MTSQLSPLSACVTRILSLSGFAKELKTPDIVAAFSEWESERGGFKIKWLNDTSLLLVFADPSVAKRAYLQFLLSPPPQFTSPTADTTALIKPYDGADAQTVIAAVNQRAGGPGGATGHRSRASLSGGPNGLGHARQSSRGGGSGAWKQQQQQQLGKLPPVATNNITNASANAPGSASGNGESSTSSGTISLPDQTHPAAIGRESPTLPSMPSHPTLNSLINSSLASLSPAPNASASSAAPSSTVVSPSAA